MNGADVEREVERRKRGPKKSLEEGAPDILENIVLARFCLSVVVGKDSMLVNFSKVSFSILSFMTH